MRPDIAEVLFDPVLTTSPPQQVVIIDDTQVQNFNSSNYLGSVISSNGLLDKDIMARIHKASQALWRLLSKILRHGGTRF